MKSDFKNLGLILVLFLCIVLVSEDSLFAQRNRETFTLEGTLTKTYKLNANGRFSVDNHNGRIEIESWDRNEVTIEVTERRGDRDERIIIKIDSSPDRIIVHTEYPDRERWGKWFQGERSKANYKIRVPREVSIFTDSHNGDIKVRGITGEVESETHNGAIFLEDINGNVSAQSHNGDIELLSLTGDISTESHNGKLTIENAYSDNIRAGTHNGRIRGEFVMDEDGRYEFTTHNGSVNITIPEDSKFDLIAHSRRNSFSSDFPVKDDDERGRRYRRRGSSSTTISSTINGGGASLRISTSNGSVRLRSR